jgi:hypothetical protein
VEAAGKVLTHPTRLTTKHLDRRSTMAINETTSSNQVIRTDSAEYKAAMRLIADILEQEERDPGYFLRQYQDELAAKAVA